MADFNFTQTGQQLQSDINLVENGIGDVFSSSQTYEVGDYVIYNDKLWKCHTAVTTAGNWTGITNWTETKITDELSNAGSGGGGGTQWYKHTITWTLDTEQVTLTVISTKSTAIEFSDFFMDFGTAIYMYFAETPFGPMGAALNNVLKIDGNTIYYYSANSNTMSAYTATIYNDDFSDTVNAL